MPCSDVIRHFLRNFFQGKNIRRVVNRNGEMLTNSATAVNPENVNVQQHIEFLFLPDRFGYLLFTYPQYRKEGLSIPPSFLYCGMSFETDQLRKETVDKQKSGHAMNHQNVAVMTINSGIVNYENLAVYPHGAAAGQQTQGPRGIVINGGVINLENVHIFYNAVTATQQLHYSPCITINGGVVNLENVHIYVDAAHLQEVQGHSGITVHGGVVNVETSSVHVVPGPVMLGRSQLPEIAGVTIEELQ